MPQDPLNLNHHVFDHMNQTPLPMLFLAKVPKFHYCEVVRHKAFHTY